MAHSTLSGRLARTQQFLKQIVYGGNDGIVTTFAVVSGFAGASADGTAQIGALAVLVFGLANLFADGVSMGLGEFLSARSQRKLYQARRGDLQARVRLDPAEAARDLAAQFERRGMAPADAARITACLQGDEGVTTELLMRWSADQPAPADGPAGMNGLVTFLAFLLFGSIPLAPYFIHADGSHNFALSVGATFVALTALGLLRSNATGEPVARSVGETVVIGGLCAAIAFGVGHLVGG
ncbi:VIT1/CCC1 transporter family protein [Actibacterium ureilyticum]|uniref:VIT1/CCC1 transporter family protein n=1 Tax=Actibacterium ureilyticum TaxID=1590614 RepID=UPI000BAAC810|nr:VIT1/CCC1 transporter family protein [Actibacterium ureilyticum]